MPDFVTLRESGMIYVDKTREIADLAAERGAFLLVRPRRFGKSLLISTFETLFAEGIGPFEGLKIQGLWRDESRCCVLRLDFSMLRFSDSAEAFESQFSLFLASAFGRWGFRSKSAALRQINMELDAWLRGLPSGRFVLLIDEYDAPLTAAIGHEALFNSVSAALAAFYAVCRANEEAFRFIFVTGIARFSGTPAAAELSRFSDISFDPKYGAIVGFSEKEILNSFAPQLRCAAAVLGLDEAEMRARLREQYGGYAFDRDAAVHVFSPWSVLNFLARPHRGLRGYWVESGGQILLLERLLANRALLNPASYAGSGMYLRSSELSMTAEPEESRDAAVLLLAGYLTIRRREGNAFLLGYPNREVGEAMAAYASERLLGGKSLPEAGAGGIRKAFEQGLIDEAVILLNRIFLSMSSHSQPVRNGEACLSVVQIMLAAAGVRTADACSNRNGCSSVMVFASHCRWELNLWFLSRREEEEGRKAKALLEEAGEAFFESRNALPGGRWTRKLRVALVFSELKGEFVLWRECSQEECL